MDSLKRVINYAWLGKRYAVVEGKENAGYADTPPTTKRSTATGLSERKRNIPLRRNTSVTKSMRDVVGTMRQVLNELYIVHSSVMFFFFFFFFH